MQLCVFVQKKIVRDIKWLTYIIQTTVQQQSSQLKTALTRNHCSVKTSFVDLSLHISMSVRPRPRTTLLLLKLLLLDLSKLVLQEEYFHWSLYWSGKHLNIAAPYTSIT